MHHQQLIFIATGAQEEALERDTGEGAIVNAEAAPSGSAVLYFNMFQMLA
jgi:hypothetical protein